MYADLLNRMRVGNITDGDIELLSSRVKSRDDPNIPKDAIYLSAINADVNDINEARLDNLDTNLLKINALQLH